MYHTKPVSYADLSQFLLLIDKMIFTRFGVFLCSRKEAAWGSHGIIHPWVHLKAVCPQQGLTNVSGHLFDSCAGL